MNRIARFLALAVLCSVGACHKKSDGSFGGPVDTKSFVAGKVVDADGKPIPGAKIQIVGSDLGSGETDANGIFNVKLKALPASGEASVKVTVAGHTVSQRRFTVLPGETASVEIACKRVEAKSDQVVSAASPPISVSTPNESVQITIPTPATTLGTTGNVAVEVTAGNPKVERNVFPGDFNATDPVTPAQTTGLSSIAFVEVKVTNTDTGQQVSNLTGNATLTVKIPEGTINPATGLSFQIGDLVPIWSFDEATGLWKRGKDAGGADIFGSVVAGPDDTLCGVFPIPHFSWWNMDYPMDQRHGLKGRIVDSTGLPVSNAAVTAFGVDQNYEFGANTNSDGFFSFDVFRGTVCRIKAKVGARETNEITVNVPDVQSTNRSAESPTNVLTSVGSLIMADGTCISGIVRNAAGQPLPNALVEVLGKNRFGNSDATGKYCVDGLDPSASVTLRVTTSILGLPVSSEIVVTTTATPGRCIDNTCLVQDIVVGTDLAGVAGQITRLSDGAPLANVNVWSDQGPFVRTGADGRYQIPSRKSTPTLVTASLFDPVSGLSYTTSAVVTPGTTTAVPGNPATYAPLDFALDIRNGCVQGVVYNELGVPVPGVNVYVSGFPVGSTDATGAYLITAPIRAGVPVFFNKYVSNGRFVSHTAFVDVTQADPACANLNVTLDAQLACVQGSLTINSLPADGVTVSTPSGIATSTDAFGNFCFDIIRNQNLTLRFFKTLASGQTLWHEQTFTVISFPGLAVPGSCATGNCTALGTISLNRIPAISAISGVPTTILSRGASTVTVTASDPDGDTLSYFWNAPAGTFASPTVASTSWTAPLVLASTVFPLSVQVNDGRGGITGATVTITVNPAPNLAPVIASVTPGAPSILTSGSTAVTAVASEPDGDAILYSWSATGGTVVGSGTAVTWQAPSVPGTYTITVTASDGNASASRSTTVAVTLPANRAPIIAALSASPAVVGRNGNSTATVSASDPDGNPLTFTWSANGGATVAGNGNSALVTAPAAPGAFQVSVDVSDGLLTTSSNVLITVLNNAPVISLLTATPSLLVGGQATILSSVAGDPEADALSYTWSQTAGPGTGAFTGTGPSVTWTAPATAGLYTLQLIASDGLLNDTETVNVTVGNRPPQVGSISATPSSVGRGASTTLAVTASDPDVGDTLTYAWTQTAGPAASTINTPNAATSTVTMPMTEGTYTFRVTVTDSGAPSQNVQATVNVVVGNRAPVIPAMTATPASVGPSGTSTIAVTASDPDGDPITYSYSATGGTISGTSASETWTGPATPALYTITVSVSDGVLTTQRTVNVTVAPDTTPPTVASIAPLNNALNVPLASTVVATFSEPVNPSTVTASSFTVSGGVTGTISFSGGNTIATFTPSAALIGTTTYTVTLTTAVQDVNGNALAAAFTSSFTTLTVTPTISIDDVTTLEGNAGSTNAVFTLTLSQATGATVTVTAQTANGTATVAGADYSATGPTVITFNPGQTTRTFTVPVLGDGVDEVNETYVVNLSLANNATILDGQGAGTITDDDGAPSLSIGDVSVTEGNAGTVNIVFTVTLAPSSGLTVTVTADTANGPAQAPGDYTAVVGQLLTFNPGETTKTVTVVANGDTTFETNEEFFVNLTNATNATIGDTQALGTITDDDPIPSATIGDIVTAETGTATFTVTLSNPSQVTTTTVQVDTANDTAAAPADYTAIVAQTVTFNAGETVKTVVVTINADALNEINETFFVNLSNPSGATIADPQAVGTITNDDPLPSLSINDVAATEGGLITFTVTLSAASGQTVTVTAATADGTAVASGDYTAVGATVLSFAPGETTKSVVVTSAADALNEANETFVVNLTLPGNATIGDNQGSGTINNDDVQPSLSINDVAIPEGNTGTATLTFTASLSTASGQTVTVTAQTSDNTATTADSDYIAAGPTLLTFAPGETAKIFQVTVNGDVTPEATETLFAVLSGETNATLSGGGIGTGTITNDDVPPISITSLSVYSGPIGAVVRVNGTNFDAVPANNIVRFNVTTATVASGTTTSLLVAVPVGATTGAVTVQVGATTSPPSDAFLVLTPPVVNTTLSVSKALSAKQHTFVPVPDAVTFLKSAVWAFAYSQTPSVNRYLAGSGDSIRIYDSATDALVAQLSHSGTNNELIGDIVVHPDGQSAYASIAGPMDANVDFGGSELQVISNLATTPTLGSRINLRALDAAVSGPWRMNLTPDGTKLLILSNVTTPTSISGRLVIVSTATNTVTNTIVLPDFSGTTYTEPQYMAIHPSGSHAYIKVRDRDDTTKAGTNERLLTFDIGSLSFLGGATLTPPGTDGWWDLVIRPDGATGFLAVRNNVSGTYSLNQMNFSTPSAPALGATFAIGTNSINEIDMGLSPQGGLLYVKTVVAGEESEPGTDVGNLLLRGFDVTGASPVLFDECYLGSSEMFVSLSPKWHRQGDRFLAVTPGVLAAASVVKQDGIVHSMRVFPNGAQADLPPFKGGTSGLPLTGVPMTVFVFDPITGLPLTGANVSLSNNGGGLLTSATTGALGEVVFPGLTGPQNVTIVKAGHSNYTFFGVDAQNLKVPLRPDDDSAHPMITVVMNGIPGGEYIQGIESSVGEDGGGGPFPTAGDNVRTASLVANERFSIGLHSGGGVGPTPYRARRQFARAVPGARLFWGANLALDVNTHTIAGNLVFPTLDIPGGFQAGGGGFGGFTSAVYAAEQGNNGSGIQNGGGDTKIAGGSIPYGYGVGDNLGYVVPAGVSNMRVGLFVSNDFGAPFTAAGLDPRVASQEADYDSVLNLGAAPAASLTGQDIVLINAPFVVSVAGTALGTGGGGFFTTDTTPTVVIRDVLAAGGSTGRYVVRMLQIRPGGEKSWVFMISSADGDRVSGGQVTFTVPDLPPAVASETFASANNRPMEIELQAADLGAGFNFNAWTMGSTTTEGEVNFLRTSSVRIGYIQGAAIGAPGPSATLANARYNHAAALLLDNNRILVAGGNPGAGPALTSAELYTASSNTLDFTRNTSTTAITSMNKGRNEVVAVRLVDGRVLLVSGTNNAGTLHSDGDLFNPADGLWSLTTTPNMAVGRIGHGAVLLNDGRVLVAGGLTGAPPNEAVVPELDIFDPATNSWSTHNSGGGANTLVARDGIRLTVLNPGGGSPTQVLVTGGKRPPTGLAFSSAVVEQNACIISVPSSGAPLIGSAIPMAMPRHGHSAVRLANGDVLLLGGATVGLADNESVFTASVERFSASGQTFALESGSLLMKRGAVAASLVSSGGVPKILLVGGVDFDEGDSTGLYELYDPSSGATDAIFFGVDRFDAKAVVVPRPGNPALDRVVIIAGKEGGENPSTTIETFDP